jgi:hypothetical protein
MNDIITVIILFFLDPCGTTFNPQFISLVHPLALLDNIIMFTP